MPVTYPQTTAVIDGGQGAYTTPPQVYSPPAVYNPLPGATAMAEMGLPNKPPVKPKTKGGITYNNPAFNKFKDQLEFLQNISDPKNAAHYGYGNTPYWKQVWDWMQPGMGVVGDAIGGNIIRGANAVWNTLEELNKPTGIRVPASTLPGQSNYYDQVYGGSQWAGNVPKPSGVTYNPPNTKPGSTSLLTDAQIKANAEFRYPYPKYDMSLDTVPEEMAYMQQYLAEFYKSLDNPDLTEQPDSGYGGGYGGYWRRPGGGGGGYSSNARNWYNSLMNWDI